MASDTHTSVIGPFSEKKLELLQRLLETSASIYDLAATPERGYEEMLVAARIFCMSSDELYFLEDAEELRQPLNHRNEAAALSLIQQRVSGDAVRRSCLLNQLHAYCERLWPHFHHEDAGLDGRDGAREVGATGETTTSFMSWAKKAGIVSSDLVVGTFPPHGIRGCFSERDILPGDDILCIPSTALMYDETVLETDLGKMLSVIPGLGMDNLLVIFTMIDRFDEDSLWRDFWRELPGSFDTGLSFPPACVDLLQGSSAYDEILKAQAHIKNQYDACTPLFDVLLKAYPDLLDAAWFTMEKYVWAVELWYSYAFEIEFPPSTKSKTVMVPFGCLLNHSPWPHCVRYGRIDATGSLRFPAFRPCKQGNQVFISYGPVPNVKLITYYGFAVNDNPHDIVPLTLEPPDGCSPKVEAVMSKYGLVLDHSLRRSGEAHGGGTQAPMSGKLWATLRVLVATEDELAAMLKGKRDPGQVVGTENEAQARMTLRQAMCNVLASLERALESCREKALDTGDGFGLSANMCLVYLKGQVKIVTDAIDHV